MELNDFVTRIRSDGTVALSARQLNSRTVSTLCDKHLDHSGELLGLVCQKVDADKEVTRAT